MSKIKFSNPFKDGLKWSKIPTEFKTWIIFLVGLFSILALVDLIW